MAQTGFSQKMQVWLNSRGKKTFGELEIVFREKSFAVAFLILMAPAALPLPTGGITHVFEIITMLLALELVFGRQTIWTPKAWKRRNLSTGLQKTALPKLIRFINWFERHSRKRWAGLINNPLFLRLVGLLVLLLTLAAFLAVPFSGLDTLPALAVIIISLSLILEDIFLILVAVIVGLAGVLLEISLGSVALHFLHF